jgi:hypothetical protein
MSIKRTVAALAAAAVLLAAGSAFADSLFLANWGVDPYTGQWSPNPARLGGIRYWSMSAVEDDVNRSTQLDGGHNYGYVGPGYGGQPFDAEAMYVALDARYLYLGVITGTPPSYTYNGQQNYGAPDPWRSRGYLAGDIFLTVGGQQYAVEVQHAGGTPSGEAVKGTLATLGSEEFSSESSPYQVDDAHSHLTGTLALTPAQFNYSPLNGSQAQYLYQHDNVADAVSLYDHYALEVKTPSPSSTGASAA